MYNYFNDNNENPGYGSEYIENLYVKEDMARNSLLVIDSSIDENIS